MYRERFLPTEAVSVLPRTCGEGWRVGKQISLALNLPTTVLVRDNTVGIPAREPGRGRLCSSLRGAYQNIFRGARNVNVFHGRSWNFCQRTVCSSSTHDLHPARTPLSEHSDLQRGYLVQPCCTLPDKFHALRRPPSPVLQIRFGAEGCGLQAHSGFSGTAGASAARVASAIRRFLFFAGEAFARLDRWSSRLLFLFIRGRVLAFCQG